LPLSNAAEILNLENQVFIRCEWKGRAPNF
jgi:hypothetical protein